MSLNLMVSMPATSRKRRRFPNYPAIEDVLAHIRQHKNHVLLNCEELAKQAGAPAQAANMVLLGAAIPMLGIEHDKMIAGIQRVFARKGEAIVNSNIAAVEAGYHVSVK